VLPRLARLFGLDVCQVDIPNYQEIGHCQNDSPNSNQLYQDQEAMISRNDSSLKSKTPSADSPSALSPETALGVGGFLGASRGTVHAAARKAIATED
jgi:hypothetical protein